NPALIVVTGLTQHEAETAVAELNDEKIFDPQTRVVAEWGDIFVPETLKLKTRREILDDPVSRGVLIDDLFGELTDDVVKRSALGALLLRYQPDIVVDSINTATAFAYQNIFDAAV